MTREGALDRAARHFDDGGFLADLARRVAIRSESQDPAQHAFLDSYLADEIGPSLAALGYGWEILANPLGGGPFLLAERTEDRSLMPAAPGMRPASTRSLRSCARDCGS